MDAWVSEARGVATQVLSGGSTVYTFCLPAAVLLDPPDRVNVGGQEMFGPAT